jgi:tetratricopeptide (TPR) repeat protein
MEVFKFSLPHFSTSKWLFLVQGHILKSTRRLAKALTLAIVFLQCSNALAQSSEMKAYESARNEAMDCLELGSQDCTDLFEKCIAELDRLKNDSLKAAECLDLGTQRMRRGRLDELSKHFFDLSLNYSKRADNPCMLMESQFALAKHARFLNLTDSTLIQAERALHATMVCGDSTKQARAEVFVGSAYLNQSNYAEALKHFQIAEVLYEALDDQSGLGGLYLDLSLLYSEMHQKPKSMNYTLKAARIFEETGEEMKYGVALTDLASTYLDVKNPDSALYYLELAEPIVRETNLRAAGYIEQNFGSAYYLKGEYQESIDHYRKGIAIAEKTGNMHLYTLLHVWISESYLAMERFDDSFRYGLIADSLSSSLPKGFLKTKALYALAKAAHKAGYHANSYYAFLDYIALTDSLFGEEKQREIAALEQKYEADKNRRTIAFQKQENELLAAANTASTNRNYALLGCLVLTLVLAYAFFNKQRYKLRGQRAAVKIKELENEKLNQEVEFKSRELTSQALNLARKNELIQSLHDKLKSISENQGGQELDTVLNQLRFTQKQEGNWEAFIEQFTALNPEFYKQFQSAHPDLSKGDLRLAALLRMGLTSKDIASMLNISEPGMKKARYRLRKKMKLGSADSLETEILNY